MFDKPELIELMEQGSAYVVDQGYGADRDLTFTEAGGRLDGADPGPRQRPRDHRGATTSAARSARATTSSKSRSSTASSTRRPPR